ncbi:MAG: radical SAM protein [Clostridia bacterium]
MQATAGIVFRDRSGEMITTMTHMPIDLNCAPFPYDSLNDFENRIIYYESSRGCPFRCGYCLSSVEKSLRFRDLKLVEKELSFFLERNVPQVKFIDRTFNCDRERALKIWRFLRDNDNGITNFHFEIAGDIMDEAQLELLSELRPGQVQLEIGVQSTNVKTLEEINRPMDFEKLSGVVDRIKSPGNVHLHLDLIAGLPFEDYESFRASLTMCSHSDRSSCSLGSSRC